MAMGIHLFTQDAGDLPCGHNRCWAGALDGPFGEHFLAMDCARCVDRAIAIDMLYDFALYVSLTCDKVRTKMPSGIIRSAAN